MGMYNSKDGYGSLTKLFHWLIVLLFALQYVGANVMMGMTGQQTVLGLAQSFFYNWHKSLGLVALAIAIARLLNRRKGRLPDWAPTLSAWEHRFIHHTEQLLYLTMFLMPVSGYVFVMAGGFGVDLFGIWKLPNPIGKWKELATAAQWVHYISSYALLAAMIGHIGLVLRHQFVVKDRLLLRMLPRRDA